MVESSISKIAMMKICTWALAFTYLCGLFYVVGSVELTEEQHENLPDFGNPKIASRLKCSACRGSAVEVHDSLQALRTKRKKIKNIKEHEYTELFETLCEDKIGAYGLQLRSNLPTQKFSKDASISRAQGNWAGRYILNICAELCSDHEEALIQHQEAELLKFVDSMCRVEMQVCDEKSIADETLGDERSSDGNEREL
mmetsp:Transcript_27260/g.55671  ORF Transcript_27260/g.55671 Transcript_27260/m.55671 type:complete len:198 (+) Transcript_27260:13-606(+)